MSEVRVGLGIDLHPWSADAARHLCLGGVRFEGEAGLAGHSDGDAVCHSVADALLGAAGLGDLGERFPDSDPELEGIAGLDLLARTIALLADHGFAPIRCDLTILAERPHVAPRREEIRLSLGAAMGLSAEEVSVKATKPEGLGLSGDGVGCLSVAMVEQIRR